MPHLVMLPFNSNKAQAHSRSTSKFNMDGNEEHSESEEMEVDFVVTSESQPIESKVISSNGIFFDIVDSSSKAKGDALVPIYVLEKSQ